MRERIIWLQIICVLLGVMGLLAYAISKFSSAKAVVIVAVVGILGCLGTLIALGIRVRRFDLITACCCTRTAVGPTFRLSWRQWQKTDVSSRREAKESQRDDKHTQHN